MTGNTDRAQEKKKGFFGRLLDKLDRKLEEKSKKAPCCGGGDDKKPGGSSCC